MKFRSDRERHIVVWGSLLGCLLVWVSLFVRPMLALIHNEEKQIPLRRADLERARELAGRLEAFQVVRPKEPVVPAIDSIIRELHISADHVKNLKDVGKGAQVQLSDLDGVTLTRLLHSLELRGIRPDSAAFKDFHDAPGGMWDVTLTVNVPADGGP